MKPSLDRPDRRPPGEVPELLASEIMHEDRGVAVAAVIDILLAARGDADQMRDAARLAKAAHRVRGLGVEPATTRMTTAPYSSLMFFDGTRTVELVTLRDGTCRVVPGFSPRVSS